MGHALKIVMDQVFLPLAGLCPARRENPWILFATQFGTLVIVLGDEGPEDHAVNELLQGLLPLSSSQFRSTCDNRLLRATVRGMVFGRNRIGEPAHPGPNLENPLIGGSRHWFAC